MTWLRNLPISRKFTYAFGIVCGLCILLGVYTFIAFRSIAAKSGDVSGNHLPSLICIGEVRDGVNAERREDLELLLCRAPACSADHGAKRQKAIAQYLDGVKAMGSLIVPEERESYLKFVSSIKIYQDASDRGIGLLTAGKTRDAFDLLSSDTVVRSLEDALLAANAGFQLHAKAGAENAQNASSAGDHATWVSSGVTLLIVMLCAFIGVQLTRLIAPPLQAATAALERVAEKDLTASVEECGSDEIGRLSAALNTSVASMREVLQSVAQGAETLSAATAEISARAVEQPATPIPNPARPTRLPPRRRR